MTESTGHLSEYLPYFRKNQKALDLYCDEPGFGGETGAYYNWCKYVAGQVRGPGHPGRPADRPAPAQRRVRLVHHRGDGDRPHVQAQRQRHQRRHDQQPAGRLLRRRPGLRGSHWACTRPFVGDLPSQCAALNLTNINVQRLTVEAALTGDPEKIVQACALDPLTAAVLTLKEIRDMAADMLEAEKQWLPQFAGKTIRPTPTIVIPKDVQPRQGADRSGAGDLCAVWGVGTVDDGAVVRSRSVMRVVSERELRTYGHTQYADIWRRNKMADSTKRNIVETALGKGNGILRLEPAWVARDFLPPGFRLGLQESRSTMSASGASSPNAGSAPPPRPTTGSARRTKG